MVNSIVTIPFSGPALATSGHSEAGTLASRTARAATARTGRKVPGSVNPARALFRQAHSVDAPHTPRGPSLPGFMAGPENRLANVALSGVLEHGESPYSPLYFHGPSGCGKTHLAQGLVRWWEKNYPKTGTVLLSGADFADQFAAAINARRVEAWRTECRTARLFVLENLHQLSGKRAAQQDLCQTLDVLEQSGALIVVTSRTLPGQIHGLAANLRSRLSAGLVVPLALPGAGVRRLIVETVAASRGLRLSRPAAHLLADSIASSVPALVGTLFEFTSAYKDATELDATQMREFLTQRSATEPPTLRSIATLTAKYFHLTLADLKSPLRRQALVSARGVAFVLARQLTDKSLDQIGVYFGGRDHTTVLHACRRTEKLSKQDAMLRQALADLKRSLTLI